MPPLVMLDVEGTGYEHANEDLKVVLPALLVSNVAIFNCSSPLRHDILSNLYGFLYQLGQSTADKTFGNTLLCIVVRDCDRNNDILRKEVLDFEDESAPGAVDRNMYRKALQAHFGHIYLTTLTTPVDSRKVNTKIADVAWCLLYCAHNHN